MGGMGRRVVRDRPPEVSLDEALSEPDLGAEDVSWDVLMEAATDMWTGGRTVVLPGGRRIFLTRGQRARLATLLASRVPATKSRMFL